MSNDVMATSEGNSYSVDEIQRVCDEFDIGKLIAVRKKLGGYFNINLKVKTTEGYYVIRRMAPSASISHIEYVQNVISTLRNEGIPVLQPLASQHGTVYSEWNGKLIQVTPFVLALPFSDSIKQVYTCGAMLRRFHDALVNVKPGPLPKWSLYPAESFLSDCLLKMRKNDEISEDLKHRVISLHDRVLSDWNSKSINECLPETVIHGDWHFWNMLYSRDGTVKYVMDFDFVQRAERIFDISYTLWTIYNLFPPTCHSAYSKSFLEGYGALTDIEKQKLARSLAKVSLFFVCSAAESARNEERLKRKLETQWEFIKWVLSHDGLKIIQSFCI